MTIGTIIADKNEFQRIISTIPDVNHETYAKEVATAIASKFKKLSKIYHPDKIREDKFNNLPYVSQIWHLLVGSNNLLKNYADFFKSYDKSIRQYRSSERFWDEEENKKNLGPIQERIQKVVEEERMEELRKQNSLKRKDDEEKMRKLNSLRRKDDEEKMRKLNSLRRKDDEENMRKLNSLKRRNDEENIRKQTTL